jgi:hypothetical protein
MRLIESFEQWLKWDLELNESKQAREYMLRRAASKLKKEVGELTDEERKEALDEPPFHTIMEAAKSYPTYINALVRFFYDQKVPIGDILEFINELPTKDSILRQLPNNIDYYASIKGERVSGWEQMNDAMRTVERTKGAKWFVDRLPRGLRDQYRAASAEEKTEFINAAHTLTELGQDVTTRLLKKIKAMADWKFSDFMDYVSKYLSGYANAEMKNKIDAVSALEPEVGIVYLDDRYLVISVRTEKAQKELCSIANWCINRGSWESYAKDAVQINIFDFGVPPTDPMFLIGTTIYYTGQTRTTHDINDAYIQKSDNTEKNLLQLGYPQNLVSRVIDSLTTETAVKKLVTGADLNKKDPISSFFGILVQGYRIDPSYEEDTFDIISDIIEARLRNDNITRDQIVQAFKKYGVVSKISAILLTKFVPDLTDSERAMIYQRTSAIYKQLESVPAAVRQTPAVAKAIEQKKEVESILGVSFE